MNIKLLYFLPLLLMMSFTFCSCNASNGDSSQPPIKVVNIDQAKKMIETQPNLIVIDVRTPEEAAEGKIANALVIDVRNSNFEKEVSKLDKSKDYLVYCRSGARSSKATSIMKNLGFTSVANMEVGYLSWKQKY